MRIVGEMGMAASHEAELERVLTFLGRNFTNTVATALGGDTDVVKACVPAAATLEKFLQAIDFKSAEAIPVNATLRRPYSAQPSFSTPQLGVKAVYLPGQRVRGNGFAGHFVVVAVGSLIDPTFGQFRRDWCPTLPNQIAIPLRAPDELSLGENGLPDLLAEYQSPNDHWSVVYETWPGPRRAARLSHDGVNRNHQRKALAALLKRWETELDQAPEDGSARSIS